MEKTVITNLEFSKHNALFLAQCEGINPPTTRQASKYRMKKGIVYKKFHPFKK